MAPFALLLGSAQDAGVPQAGCACATCQAARRRPDRRRLVACLGLVDPAADEAWLVDATPDLGAQLDRLAEAAPGFRLAGICLTHAHMGHYLGLAQLGREAMATRDLPVLASDSVGAFLRANAPWSRLVADGHIALTVLEPERAVPLGGSLTLLPIPVPHRAEHGDTLAFLVRGPERSLLYCPDIDRWEDWDRDLATVVAGVDVALLDGTFFSADELPGARMAEVPHPPVVDTVERLTGCPTEVCFVHLNHTNPLLAAGRERRWLRRRGRAVAAEGQRWPL